LTEALKGQAKDVSGQLADKLTTITGDVIDCKGKPEIIITDPHKLNGNEMHFYLSAQLLFYCFHLLL
jgi:hypothetical protein